MKRKTTRLTLSAITTAIVVAFGVAGTAHAEVLQQLDRSVKADFGATANSNSGIWLGQYLGKISGVVNGISVYCDVDGYSGNLLMTIYRANAAPVNNSSLSGSVVVATSSLPTVAGESIYNFGFSGAFLDPTYHTVITVSHSGGSGYGSGTHACFGTDSASYTGGYRWDVQSPFGSIEDWYFVVNGDSSGTDSSVIITSPTTDEEYLQSPYSSYVDITVNVNNADEYEFVDIEVLNYGSLEVVDSTTFGISTGISSYTGRFSSLVASTTYIVSARLRYGDVLPTFGNGSSDVLFLHNGEESPGFGQFGEGSNVNASSAWEDAGCDSLGITDVFDGIKCGLIWAFYPDYVTLSRIREFRDEIALKAPWGYATLMVSAVTEASQQAATSTPTVTVAFASGPFSGHSMTLFDFDSMDSMVDSTIMDLANAIIPPLMWLGFAWATYKRAVYKFTLSA
jgi:hypothetical protein